MPDRQESAASSQEAGPPKHDHPVLRRVFRVVLIGGATLYFVAAGSYLGVVHEARILGNTDESIPAAHKGGVQVSRANQVERLDRLRSALMGLP
ncbi:MAG: hypothetical protein VB141_08245, partial [Burkholderia gladioli]